MKTPRGLRPRVPRLAEKQKEKFDGCFGLAENVPN